MKNEQNIIVQKCAKKVCDAQGENTVSEWQMIIWKENLPPSKDYLNDSDSFQIIQKLVYKPKKYRIGFKFMTTELSNFDKR